MTELNRFIGAPIERLEDLRLLRGRGIFIDDLQREGMLHAVMVRSNVAHGICERSMRPKHCGYPALLQ